MFFLIPVVPEMGSDTSPLALSWPPTYRGERCLSRIGGTKNKDVKGAKKRDQGYERLNWQVLVLTLIERTGESGIQTEDRQDA